MVYTMELMGMEQAHAKLRSLEKDGTEYYCVGYSIVKYYLGNVQLTNLIGHRGNKISADVLATFLPRDVIDGLYSVCDKAGLKVLNLTLEKLEAMTCVCSVGLDMIAIPGDTPAESVAGVIADEMAIGMTV